jgi:hypothetical protein
VSQVRSNVAYGFSGHQTFPFRYTWLPKGVRHLRDDPSLFGQPNAFVTLGVGKNMVRSIRHWCVATGVFDRVDHRGTVRISDLGDALFGEEEGWDPYLEDPGTLWLLHWRLVSRPTPASTWHLAFTRWNTDGFAREDLADWLLDFTGGSSGAQTTQASLRRDVEVFLRTYVPSQAKGASRSAEDTFDCPLVELGLLVQESARGAYRFARGPKPTLPDEIFAYALLDYWTLAAGEGQSLSFETLLHRAGGPGGAFQLSVYREAAAPELFPGEPVEDAYYYSLRHAERVKTKEPDEETLENLSQEMRDSLEEGHLPPDVLQRVCPFCEFDLVCRRGPRLDRKETEGA